VKRAAASLAALVLLAGAECRPARREPPASVVAIIDGAELPLPLFRRYFESNAGRPITESSPKVVSALFDQFLREEIWRRAAGLRGDDDAGERRRAPGILLARAGAAVVPTKEEISLEFDAHRDKYRRPEEVSVARIGMATRAAAEKARSRVVRGEPFESVAREMSRAPDAARGGEMGVVARGDLPAEFEDAIFRLKPGEMTSVIPAEDGFLIFRVESRMPARQLDLDEAAPEIRRMLAERKADAYLREIVERERKESRIRVLADHLPFVYSGDFLPRGD